MFFRAAFNGEVEKVKKILRENPSLKVNSPGYFSDTVLYHACENGYDSIVSILLAHPDIDVNQKDQDGKTPFMTACFNGNTSCVRLLLQDHRVMVNEPSNNGNTPLKWAAYHGHHDVIKWWIVWTRDGSGNLETDAIRKAKNRCMTEVVDLLERFKESPERTRYQVRVELGLVDEMAAKMFSLVVFVSDGFLQVTQVIQCTTSPAVRFFAIACQLPLELQMVLCYRVAGSCKEIPGRECEMAFKELARRM